MWYSEFKKAEIHVTNENQWLNQLNIKGNNNYTLFWASLKLTRIGNEDV